MFSCLPSILRPGGPLKDSCFQKHLNFFFFFFTDLREGAEGAFTEEGYFLSRKAFFFFFTLYNTLGLQPHGFAFWGFTFALAFGMEDDTPPPFYYG